MGKISVMMRKEIIEQMLKKKTRSEVSSEMGISQPTVRANSLKYLNTGSIKILNRSGRPLKTSEKERRLIARISKKNPFSPQDRLEMSLVFFKGVNLHRQTRASQLWLIW